VSRWLRPRSSGLPPAAPRLAHEASAADRAVRGGGLADIAGRAYADALGTAFGQPFLVENRPGGGGMAAAEAIMRGEPDGYTLMVSGSRPW